MSGYTRTKEYASVLSSLGKSLDFELTYRCNNNCVHCCVNVPQNEQSVRAREMTTAETIRILEEAVSLGYLSVRFTGGEPMLREDFPALYLAARKMGLGVCVFTNATLITPEIADMLALVPSLEQVEVTVYGMTQRSYESVSRAPGSFEAAWRGIALLSDRRVPFIVKGALLPMNRHEMDNLEAWATTLPEMGKLVSYAKYFGLRSRRDDNDRNEVIRRMRLTPEAAVAIAARTPEVYLDEWRAFLARFASPYSNRVIECGLHGAVDPYGYLHPCLSLADPGMAYDLRNGSLEDGLKSIERLRNLISTNPDYLARCARCFLRDLCEQCPARAWAEHGACDVPIDYFCDITHAMAVYLELLNEGEKTWQIEDWTKRVAAFVEP